MARPPRVRARGKYFELDGCKWTARGATYGPFPPGPDGELLPSRDQVARDCRQLRAMGGNALRVYHVPPVWFLDEVLQHGVRVLVDVPWEKHRCFLDDWTAVERARDAVRRAARQVGHHPAVMAISVANELPSDIVRYLGVRRVERFLTELMLEVRRLAPDCPVSFTNFPTTEFLQPDGADFASFNVYLERNEDLSRYLDRLQHLAGDVPLLLAEHGADSLRASEGAQAALVADQLDLVRRRGLAGSFVFSFTDQWYTGGQSVEDWAFGLCRADRSPKPAAEAACRAWLRSQSGPALPKASVVVCAYDAEPTLRECLESLRHLDYPDYEVVVVDDGSRDATAAIAAGFAGYTLIRQPNLGLSAARNVGAGRATGDVIVYTDADCVADVDWLRRLVEALVEHDLDAVGGPNLTPESDGWVARCVSASPGNPCHVMLDDVRAEHVPGCNMAFRRAALQRIGGFDARFRAAGDDVDLCWRLLDVGCRIGFAPGAMVWHHRRSTVKAFLRQQRGYARAEAMLFQKHPHRFSALGRSRWSGVVYGSGARALPTLPSAVYHGARGGASYQTIYRHNRIGLRAVTLSLEWHVGTALLLLASTVWLPAIAGAAAMLAASLLVAAQQGARAALPAGAPWWSRSLIAALHLLQPAARTWHRHRELLRCLRLPPGAVTRTVPAAVVRREPLGWDLAWDDRAGRGRDELLAALDERAGAEGWSSYAHDGYSPWDERLLGDPWYAPRIQVATEELGRNRRFTRARIAVVATPLARWTRLGITMAVAVAAMAGAPVALAATALLGAGLAAVLLRSRRLVLRTTAGLVARAAEVAGFAPAEVGAESAERIVAAVGTRGEALVPGAE